MATEGHSRSLQMDMDLEEFGVAAAEIKCLRLEEKEQLVKSFRNSLDPNGSPKQVATPARTRSSKLQIETERERLLRAGVSLISISENAVPEEEQDEVQVLAEVVTPRRTTLQRPSRLWEEDIQATLHDQETPAVTPKSPVINCVPTKRRIAKGKQPDESPQVLPSTTPATNRKLVLVSSHDYVENLPEIYQTDPLGCKDNAESTLRPKSAKLRKRSTELKPFFATGYALSLKTDDYLKLWAKRFGYDKVPTEPKLPEIKPRTQKAPSPSEPGPSNSLDYSFDGTATCYNLRQRCATKRSAENVYELNISDDSDSDSITPIKKFSRTEKDDNDFFLPLMEAATPKRTIPTTTGKTRGGRLSLVASAVKNAADRNVVDRNVDLLIVDTDEESGDSDVPGKEIVVPKMPSYLQAVAGKSEKPAAGKWKTAKPKVSAVPNIPDGLQAEFDEDELPRAFILNKTKQPRAKPSDALKPGPMSGKNRRLVLGDVSPARRPRVRQPRKLEGDKDDDKAQEEELPEAEDNKVQCPLCTAMFAADDIQMHVNACCDEAGTEPFEPSEKNKDSKCPLCFQFFSELEITSHCDGCEGPPEEMDEA